MTIEPFGYYHATIRTRRGPGFDVKPEVAVWLQHWEGKRIVVLAGWRLEGDSRHTAYPETEWAMLIESRAEMLCPITWMASGDLADLELLSMEEASRRLTSDRPPEPQPFGDAE